jgi:hypothetical protein
MITVRINKNMDFKRNESFQAPLGEFAVRAMQTDGSPNSGIDGIYKASRKFSMMSQDPGTPNFMYQ